MIPFGKYDGKSVEQVYNIDKSFLDMYLEIHTNSYLILFDNRTSSNASVLPSTSS
jgi:hypothetical protein